jgi:hypothetical protein
MRFGVGGGVVVAMVITYGALCMSCVCEKMTYSDRAQEQTARPSTQQRFLIRDFEYHREKAIAYLSKERAAPQGHPRAD